MSWFSWLSLGGLALSVATAAALRGRLYATFVGVLLSVHTLISLGLASAFGPFLPLAAAFQLATFTHFVLLARPKLRSFAYRALISMPASWFAAGTMLALPWAVASAFGVTPHGFFVPYVLALAGLVQSLRHPVEEIDVAIDDTHQPSLSRFALGASRVDRPLRVVQITDPHLGPFMSEERLRGIAERAVAANPDLVLLTGDFLTMESHHARDSLARALAPLSALPGRVFACRGNHDHEAPATVAGALRDIGATLLIDDAATVLTEAGPVQIVGIDFRWADRAEHTRAVCERHPRAPGHLRLVLLHDPGAFKHLPDGEADLVLAGHTHGGQLGLLSFGLPHTFVSLFTEIPDHGYWALGKNRLYVHRGTGHYGFPLRIGVPGEESLLRVHAKEWSAGLS